MSRHLNDQYFGGNKLKEVGLPVDGPDAANKTYVDEALAARGVHIYRTLTGTEAVTSSPYYCALWDATDESVTEYKDGMVVCVKVPVKGNGSYGTALQINGLGYKPVVYNVNTMISTRYGVGSVVWAVYNRTQTAKLYLGQGHQNEDIIGCWQVMDYNSDTTTVTTVRRYYSARVKPTAELLSSVIVFRKNETHVVPIHSVPAGTSGTNAYTASNATNKTMTTESFDPFGKILWYSNSKKINADTIIETATLYMQYGGLIDARRIFNCGQTLVGNRELYLVVDLQSDGMVKLATTPWSQTLPTTNDGHLYIFLGITYDTYRFEFLMYHPIYYHDGTQLRMYTGAKQFSGNYNDLTNKPTIPTVPTNVSEFTNDAGYLTPNDVPQEVFVCNYNSSNNTMDKTAAEIYAAFTAGKVVICKNGAVVYTLDGSSSDTCRFHSVQNQGSSLSFKWIKYIGGAWSTGQDDWNSKQNALIGSGTGQNIKTINNESILGSGNISTKEIFRCEMLAQSDIQGELYGYTFQCGVYYADIQAAVNTGKTVLCNLYDDLTSQWTLLVNTGLKLTGSSIYNNVLYCFEAIFGGGTGNEEVWNVQRKAIQTNIQLPALSGNEYKMLSVNGDGDGVEWTTPFSGSYNDLADKPVNASFGTGIVYTPVNNTSASITVSFSNYTLVNGGLVSIAFNNDVPANATLNINGKGAKSIFFRGTAIKAGVILAGDRCLFMYNSGYGRYFMLSNDRWGVGV